MTIDPSKKKKVKLWKNKLDSTSLKLRFSWLNNSTSGRAIGSELHTPFYAIYRHLAARVAKHFRAILKGGGVWVNRFQRAALSSR